MVHGWELPLSLLPTSLQTLPCQGLLLHNQRKHIVNVDYAPAVLCIEFFPGSFSTLMCWARSQLRKFTLGETWSRYGRQGSGDRRMAQARAGSFVLKALKYRFLLASQVHSEDYIAYYTSKCLE